MKRLRNAFWWVFNGFDCCVNMLSRIEALEQRNEELSKALVDAISELNAIRTAQPTPKPQGNTTVLRNWREFRSAAERRGPVPGSPQPISLER